MTFKSKLREIRNFARAMNDLSQVMKVELGDMAENLADYDTEGLCRFYQSALVEIADVLANTTEFIVDDYEKAIEATVKDRLQDEIKKVTDEFLLNEKNYFEQY